MPSNLTTLAASASHANQSSVTSTAFTTFAFVFLALRLITRGLIVRNVGIEDYTIFAAWVCSLILTICVWQEVSYGQGRHLNTLTIDQIQAVLRWLWTSLPFYQGGLALTKFSILLQYHRIFTTSTMRRPIYILGGICVVYGAWSVLSNIFMCTPVSYFWNKGIPGGHCMSSTIVWFSNAAGNIATDFAIFILPLPILNSLRLPRPQKIGLLCVFALGGFVCLVSILRLKSLHDITTSTDPTFDNGPIAYWSSVELNVGIICASLPSLRALGTRFFPHLLGVTATHELTHPAQQHGAARTASAAPTRTADQETWSRTLVDPTGTVAQVEAKRGDNQLGANGIHVITVVEQGTEDTDSVDSDEKQNRLSTV